MTDPAVEAAERAVRLHYPPRITEPSTCEIDSAREALKPIRATHERWEKIFGGSRGDVPEMIQVLLGELTPLIFTTEELER
ncbi:hypothetical protein [Mycobacteroides abscessus]